MNETIKEVINIEANAWTIMGTVCGIFSAAIGGIAALVALATGGFEAMKDML